MKRVQMQDVLASLVSQNMQRYIFVHHFCFCDWALDLIWCLHLFHLFLNTNCVLKCPRHVPYCKGPHIYIYKIKKLSSLWHDVNGKWPCHHRLCCDCPFTGWQRTFSSCILFKNSLFIAGYSLCSLPSPQKYEICCLMNKSLLLALHEFQYAFTIWCDEQLWNINTWSCLWDYLSRIWLDWNYNLIGNSYLKLNNEFG